MLGIFDHIGIVVSDIEKAIEFYSEVLGWNLPSEGPYSRILNVNIPGEKIRYVMLSSGDTYLELIEPQEGVWMEYLEEKGEGAICELCVLVDDIKAARSIIESKGICPCDRFGNPLKDEFEEAPSGSRYFYLSSEDSFGTWIEILERPWLNQ
ncbi:MAG: VOC family protein [Candidatus Thorarchaeota archaeon]